MNGNLSSSRLRLEVLPDELFLEIFQYVDPVDLCSFKGLNRRIDGIIEAVRVNIAVQWQEDYELDYISSFTPTQIIRLEIHREWPLLNLHTLPELRSLTLDCNCLSKEQMNQIVSVRLPHLERLSVDSVTHDLQESLLDTLFQGEHFPSLTTCRLKLEYYYTFELNEYRTSSTNNAIRCFTIDRWNLFNLGSLWNQLPNLRRFETSFDEWFQPKICSSKPHLSIKHVQVTLSDPLHDLEKLLALTPNLARLRVRGGLGRSSVTSYFEKLAKLMPKIVPLLQRFDCEVYCYSTDTRENEFNIQKLHTFFKKVRCLSGHGHNQCYATDMKIYPLNNEYEESSPRPLVSHTTSSFHHYYDEYDRYNDDYYQDYDNDEDEAWARNEYGNGPGMYWDGESDEWCPLP
ncbi:unnamed protein product [Adineta ricciae]|uniref:F-box domain-containing protein n=1 Tax=Adineta ricciae TaxID=249248 RepID=A0A815VLE6_ADIRI|nr:unnamed protein product [Adineta ricciae]CAF1531990.1 unnamed protein product [Adineta ricciae]